MQKGAPSRGRLLDGDRGPAKCSSSSQLSLSRPDAARRTFSGHLLNSRESRRWGLLLSHVMDKEIKTLRYQALAHCHTTNKEWSSDSDPGSLVRVYALASTPTRCQRLPEPTPVLPRTHLTPFSSCPPHTYQLGIATEDIWESLGGRDREEETLRDPLVGHHKWPLTPSRDTWRE